MPLIDPLPADTNEEVRELAKFFNETLGFCPNSVLTMQLRPAIAKSFISLNTSVMENNGRVTSALKRLIGYVASRVAGCNYCQAHTIRAAERYGAEREQLEHIWEYQTHSAFSDIPNGVDSSISDRLHEHWDEGEIVEILGVIGLFGFLNRWNDSMATALEQPAAESAQQWLSDFGWSRGKHSQ